MHPTSVNEYRADKLRELEMARLQVHRFFRPGLQPPVDPGIGPAVVFSVGKEKVGRSMEEMPAPEIESFLQNQLLGRLAMADRGGRPYVIPLPFCYVNGCIYLRLPMTGRKGAILKFNPQVCFEVDACSPQMDDYTSVIIDGTLTPVSRKDEKQLARDAATEKYTRLRGSYRPGHKRQTPLEDLPTVRIDPACISGRKIATHQGAANGNRSAATGE
jgi:nitroimidazol reductase NimA-like FMN-containing flavoprotein (pyridoxamine 5'-phosphate oxidase superfamily)